MAQAGTTYDLAVVGGGINGAAIARDAAGRGLSVLLVEQDDLAAHTSSASTKLIHGGLRYLEHYAFAMVRKALAERELLLASAPHLVAPLRLVIPQLPGMRPAWMVRAGLFLYDHLARRERLPACEGLDLARHRAGAALHERLRKGFAYSDGFCDDARLVVMNALDAAQRGATVATRTRCESATADGESWRLALRSGEGVREVCVRALVNAAGPWAGAFAADIARETAPALRLVKGSHIVLARRYAHDYAYLFQHDDGRVIFAIPWEDDFTLVGTTEAEFAGDPAQAAITPGEIEYLCAAASRYLRQPVRADEVCAHFAGVRPLLDEPGKAASAVTREWRLDLSPSGPPLVSVLGGKLTTHRVLAQEAIDLLAPRLGCARPRWTAGALLPGAGLPDGSRAAFEAELARDFPWLPERVRRRWVRSYGTLVRAWLAHAAGPGALGEEVAPELFELELRHLVGREWARTPEDILRRRTRLGLRVAAAGAQALAQWLALPRADALASRGGA